MRKRQPLAGQHIHDSRQRRHAQNLGKHRRVDQCKIAHPRMPSEISVFVTPRLNAQISAFHVFIQTQHLERASRIVGVDGQHIFVAARLKIELHLDVAARPVVADQIHAVQPDAVAQFRLARKIGYRHLVVGPKLVYADDDIGIHNVRQRVFQAFFLLLFLRRAVFLFLVKKVRQVV